jgi:ferritin
MGLKRKIANVNQKKVVEDSKDTQQYKRVYPLSKDILKAQIEKDLTNDRLFLMFASWCNSSSYPKAAKYFFRKSEKSRNSAIELLKFLQENDVEVNLPKPGDIVLPDEFGMEAIIQMNLNTEIETTDSISDLYFAAHQDKAALLIPMIFDLLERQKCSEKDAKKLLGLYKRYSDKDELEDKINDILN